MNAGIDSSRFAPAENAPPITELQRRRLPDHDALVIGFGQLDRLRQAIEHRRSDRVHLAFERHDDDIVFARAIIDPCTHGIRFEQRLAVGLRIDARFAGQRRAEDLLLIHIER